MINKKLDKLFKKYKTEKNFFKDGIFDEKKFKQSKIKILFILKEVNNKGKKDNWDLREVIIKYNHELDTTWRHVGKIFYSINNKFPIYKKIENLSDENIRESVHSVASINLSKETGKGSASDSEIRKKAERYFELWKKQIDIIKPNITICGGTFDIVSELFKKNKIIQEKEIKKANNGMTYFYYKKILFIDFVHPAFFGRCRFSFGYSYLKEGLKDVKIARL